MANKLHTLMNEMGDFGGRREIISMVSTNPYEEERLKKVEEAIKLLLDVANSGSTIETANAMAFHLGSQHRYLQSELMESIIGLVSRYADAGYDARNKCAVAQCRLLDEVIEEHHLGAAKERS